MKERPKVSTTAERELDKLDKQFQEFDENVKSMTLDRMNMAPKEEKEQQTKMSTREAQRVEARVLQPARSLSSNQKFNENFRSDRTFLEEKVRFIAENNEIIGELIEFWTKPFGGMNAEFWQVPPNKPVIAPRYVAERLKGCTYHRLIMQDQVTSTDGVGQYYGSMAVDTIKQRLDAHPVSDRKTTFMSGSF